MINVPADPPVEIFWAITVYDVDTRGMVRTDQERAERGSRHEGVRSLPDGTTRIRGTDVLLQQRTTVNLPVDFTIDESALEEVLVTASNVLMETSGSSLSGAIDSATFDALPVGQEYRDLIKLIPGVQFTQDGVRGPSAGGNGQDNTYQFDGVDVSLPLFGTLSTQPSTHDIDQVSIVRGGGRRARGSNDPICGHRLGHSTSRWRIATRASPATTIDARIIGAVRLAAVRISADAVEMAAARPPAPMAPATQVPWPKSSEGSASAL